MVVGLVITGFVSVGLYQALQATTIRIQPYSEVHLDCMEQNLSGITYNKDTGTLFMVTNEPVVLFQVSIQGDCLASYSVNGLDDVEDVVYIGNNQYLLVEERRHRVNLIELSETTAGVKIVVHHSFKIPQKNKPNKGLEGIAYDDINDEIFLVSEFPRRIYHIKHWRKDNSLQVDELNINPSLLLMGDYSAINIHQGKLLVLSDRSSRLLKLNQNGNDVYKINLVDGKEKKLQQAEGIAVNQQNLFVVSEPKHLYVYQLDTKSAVLLGMNSDNDNFLN